MRKNCGWDPLEFPWEEETHINGISNTYSRMVPMLQVATVQRVSAVFNSQKVTELLSWWSERGGAKEAHTLQHLVTQGT